MSQEELAAVIGCSCTTVSNWERAQTVPEDRDLVLALGQELSLRSIEGDQLLAAADFATQTDEDSTGLSIEVNYAREITYRQPKGQIITQGDDKSSVARIVTFDEVADVSVEFQIRITDDGGSDDNWAGVRVRGFHTSVMDIGFGYLLHVRSNGQVEIFREIKPIAVVKDALLGRAKGQWVTLRMDILSTTIQVWINGKRRISIQDEKFGKGYVCLHTFFVQAEFKNLQIYCIAL